MKILKPPTPCYQSHRFDGGVQSTDMKIFNHPNNGLLSIAGTKALVGNLVAWPCAYHLMNQWLQAFAYRIELDLGVFMLGGILALLIALATVSYQTVRAAMANPIDALKYE